MSHQHADHASGSSESLSRKVVVEGAGEAVAAAVVGLGALA